MEWHKSCCIVEHTSSYICAIKTCKLADWVDKTDPIEGFRYDPHVPRDAILMALHSSN